MTRVRRDDEPITRGVLGLSCVQFTLVFVYLGRPELASGTALSTFSNKEFTRVHLSCIFS